MNKLKEIRKAYKLNQTELAKKLNTTQQTISNWENGITDIDLDSLSLISSTFNLSIDYILGKTDLPVDLSKLNYNDNVKLINLNDQKLNQIPILGAIAAGTPIESINDRDYNDCIVADTTDFGNGTYFGLRISGDSMSPRILEDDIAVIKVCDWVNSGDIAAIKVNGDAATLKIVKFEQDGMWLIGINPNFKPIYYTAKECEDLPVTVIGKLVQVIQKY